MLRTADACTRQRSVPRSCKCAKILMVVLLYLILICLFSYVMMLQCWRSEPWERPSFRRCLSTLQSISGELRRSELPEIEGSSASSSASCVSVVGKPEMHVHFDEEHNQTKDASNTSNKNNTSSSSQSASSPANDNRQLYANEGVSRL